MDERNYEQDISIDVNSLDLEWNQQAFIFGYYSKQLAKAIRNVNRVWEKLKIRRSELIQECRENDPKASAPVMEAYYRTNEDHQKLKQDLFDAEYERDILQNAVYALNHKKAALEKLVILHGQSYFAGPVIPNDINRTWEKQATPEKLEERKEKRAKRKRS